MRWRQPRPSPTYRSSRAGAPVRARAGRRCRGRRATTKSVARRRTSTRGRSRRKAVAARPTASTGRAAFFKETTSTAAASVATAPTRRRIGGGSRSAGSESRSRNANITKAAVIAQAAIQAGSIRAAKATLLWGSPRRTSRLVRLEPGRRSEAALAMNTEPYRNGRSSSLRGRAACTSTGVRKTTDVLRLSTAVTAATRPSSASSRPLAPRRAWASRAPSASNNPSAAATAPMSSSPVTSTNGGHGWPAEVRAVCSSTINS